jgi:glycosyltransferase involved in cell wall biosynthesis
MYNIVINGRFLTQSASGVQRFAFEIARRLRQLYPDSIVICPSQIIQKKWAVELQAHIIGTKTGHLWEQWVLPRFMQKHPQALLINLGNTAPIFFSRHITVLHDVAFRAYPTNFHPLFAVWYRFMVAQMSRKARALVTVSHFSQSEIIHYYPQTKDKTYVIYNGLSLPICSKTNSVQPYFLFVGNLDPRKNLSTLLQAMMLTSFDTPIKLKIVGASHKIFAKQALQLPPSVEILGAKDDTELQQLYQHAIALIYPSFYEGFGLPPLEAMSQGCPCIVSDIPVLHEILGNAAYFVNPHHAQDIADAMTKLNKDITLRQSLQVRGWSQCKLYDWDKTAQQLYTIIEQNH